MLIFTINIFAVAQRIGLTGKIHRDNITQQLMITVP